MSSSAAEDVCAIGAYSIWLGLRKKGGSGAAIFIDFVEVVILLH